MLEDPIQNIEWDNCGTFQLQLFEKIFGGNAKSQTFKHKKLRKKPKNTKAVEVLLSKIFSLDVDNNERTIGEYTERKEIKFC